MFYTRLKEGLAAEGRPQVAVNFASGVVAAVVATLLTQPADVVRTRMQLGLVGQAGAAAGGAAAAGAQLGAWGTLHQALRQQGPSALLTGGAWGCGGGTTNVPKEHKPRDQDRPNHDRGASCRGWAPASVVSRGLLRGDGGRERAGF